MERPTGLKLILKVGSNSTPEHGSGDSPAYGLDMGGLGPSGLFGGSDDYPERHKKSKKKKKKKDREKRHKHHHKEKRRHREDSSQEDFSIGDDTTQFQETMMSFADITTKSSLASNPVSKPIMALPKPDELELQLPESLLNINPPTESISPVIPPSIIPIPFSDAQQCFESPVQSNIPAPMKGSADSGKSASSNESLREQRTCVLKLKQSKSPLSKLLEHLLKSLEKRDPQQFFAWPVTDDIAPGYSTIITNPMDFSTIRQKMEDNQYTTIAEFSNDFKLMCENAIRYNHVDTIYHKAAKRLLHVGNRLLQPENMMRSLRPLMNYMAELTSKELGFELWNHTRSSLDHHENESITMDSGDEGLASTEEGHSLLNEEDEKRRIMRKENDPKSRFDPFVDDLTPEEILSQVQNASIEARNRLNAKKKPHQMGFLRQNRDGTTSMRILVEAPEQTPERVVSIGAFTGKLQQGTGQLQTFREDRRNIAKIVKPLNYGAFSSFAPVYDSRFSNLSKEETDLVLSTYGDESSFTYAESLLEFTKNSPYARGIANNLLDMLTAGEHQKTMAVLVENQLQKHEQFEIEQTFPDAEDLAKKYENIKVDFDGLKTLSNIGLDVSYLDNIQQDWKLMEIQKKLQTQLDTNSSLIEKLHQVQYERLSQPLPNHLAHIAKPNMDEIQLAQQLTSNLTEMAKQLQPGTLVPAQALRKAMGMSNVGLEPYVPPRMNLGPQPPPRINLNQNGMGM